MRNQPADSARTSEKRLIYDRVAQLHIECIDGGFLPTLGPRFLALMYRSIDEGQDSVLLVRRQGSVIVGFVAGATGMRPILRRMLRRWVTLAFALAPSLVSFTRLKRIFEIVQYSKETRHQDRLPSAELLSIGVDAAFRRQGHAEALFNELCCAFREKGVPTFTITVGESLGTAHLFYRRMGATEFGSVAVHRGERSIVYKKTLTINSTGC